MLSYTKPLIFQTIFECGSPSRRPKRGISSKATKRYDPYYLTYFPQVNECLNCKRQSWNKALALIHWRESVICKADFPAVPTADEAPPNISKAAPRTYGYAQHPATTQKILLAFTIFSFYGDDHHSLVLTDYYTRSITPSLC